METFVPYVSISEPDWIRPGFRSLILWVTSCAAPLAEDENQMGRQGSAPKSQRGDRLGHGLEEIGVVAAGAHHIG